MRAKLNTTSVDAVLVRPHLDGLLPWTIFHHWGAQAMAFREQPSERIQFARSQRRMSSRCEEALWRELRGRRLAGWKFRRQASIGRYFADFYCEAARLVVEADGPAHADDEQRARDRARDAWFASRGYRVLRFKEDDILGDPQRVLDRIAHVLAQTPRV